MFFDTCKHTKTVNAVAHNTTKIAKQSIHCLLQSQVIAVTLIVDSGVLADVKRSLSPTSLAKDEDTTHS